MRLKPTRSLHLLDPHSPFMNMRRRHRSPPPPPLCIPSTLQLCATYLCELPLQLYYKTLLKVVQLQLRSLQSVPLFRLFGLWGSVEI